MLNKSKIMNVKIPETGHNLKGVFIKSVRHDSLSVKCINSIYNFIWANDEL